MNPVNVANSVPTPGQNVPVLKKEFLDMIPEFNGEQTLLSRFIDICDKLVRKFFNTRDLDDFQNEYLLSSIRAKIKGEAAVNISSCQIRTWIDLKTALLNTYSDKRDWFTLNIELTELKQNYNENVFDFYNRIQKLLNLQVSYTTNHANANEASVLIGYFKKYALRILLRGLKEPIGHLLRAKNPEDLNSALNMLTNDFQFEKFNDKNVSKSQINVNKNTGAVPKNQYNNTFKTNYKPNFNKPNPHNQTQNQYQNFNKQYPSFKQKPQANVFKPNQFSSFNTQKPTPMSISTRNSPMFKSNQNKFQQKPNFNQNQKFISEELFNLTETNQEIENDYSQQQLQEYEYDNYTDDNYDYEINDYTENNDENTFLEKIASD